MAGEPLEPVYLIVGGDLPKIAAVLRRLRARFDAGSIEQFVAGSGAELASGADVTAALNALGLFGGGERLVIVELVERWSKADVDVITSYLESPTAGAVLALTGDAATTSRRARGGLREGRQGAPVRHSVAQAGKP